MKQDIFHHDNLIFFDGAMGTMIQAAGLNSGELPEGFNITRPEVIESIHQAYREAGADVTTTNTFGANRLKLGPAGYTPEQMVKAAVAIARKAAGNGPVALDIGPLGQLMAPMGTLSFSEAYDLFAPQMKAGQNAGADFVLIETMSDLYEAKAAVLAARENTRLPVVCTLTFQKNGRTLMGNDPLTVVTVLESLGVEALGINCSLGPEDLLPLVKQFADVSHVPILVQPNAGLPELVGGRPVFPLTPVAFADSVEKMADMGIKMVGGCCGTDPNFIKELRSRLGDRKYRKPDNPKRTAAASARQTVFFDRGFRLIGQRIDPSGREDLEEAIRKGETDPLYEEAMLQKQAGAEILSINVYTGDPNEGDAMVKAVEAIQAMIPVPLQLSSSDYRVLEAGARVANGKPVVHAVNGSRESMEQIFPIVRKYGACVVGRTLDENGIPCRAEDSLAIAEKILETAAGYGIPREDILIDCLVRGIAPETGAARETLKAVSLVKRELGGRTLLDIGGVSREEEGRPARNGVYLAMAMGAGLDAAMADPTAGEIREVIRAYRDLIATD